MSISMTLEELDNRRKRLIFRSWHRGTREMDLIMGSFAEVNVPAMDARALDLYEELLHTSDPDVYDWISGQKPVPANRMNPVIEKLLSHNYADHSPAGHDKS
ncbi:MAG TPA: succinate dehydrogenase assembly factor 2 [Micavibrio sp.]|jgi:antitoxin CptB|nr:succinate dehydrogenase assembly factor 2 [Micavibrio sp.]